MKRTTPAVDGDAPAPLLVFVDAIDDDVARIAWNQETFSFPLALLPSGTKEGAWVSLTMALVPEPVEAGEAGRLRDHLVKDDPGGDIKL